MNVVEMDDLVDTNGGGEKTGDRLHPVGTLWKGSEIFGGKIWYHRIGITENAMNVWTKTMHR